VTGVGGDGAIYRLRYNMGNVTNAAGSGYNLAGGIAGLSSSSYVSNVYNIGLVNAAIAGGIIGDASTFSLINCYYLSSSATKPVGVYGTGTYPTRENLTSLTEPQMCQQSSFVGFDFTTVWAISTAANNGYPYLRSLQL